MEKIGLVIGPGGKNVRALEELGVEVDIEEDGTVRIYSSDLQAAPEAKKRIEDLTREAKVGEIYEGTVTRITPSAPSSASSPAPRGFSTSARSPRAAWRGWRTTSRWGT